MTDTPSNRAAALAALDQIRAHRRELPAKLAAIDGLLEQCTDEQREAFIADLGLEWIQSYAMAHEIANFLNATKESA